MIFGKRFDKCTIVCYNKTEIFYRTGGDFVKFPDLICIFHLLTGLYCQACGGTRSMKALFDGQILLSVHENAASPFLILILLLWGIEQLLKKSGKSVRLFPRNGTFWKVLLILWLVWAILRNLIPSLQPYT